MNYDGTAGLKVLGQV